MAALLVLANISLVGCTSQNEETAAEILTAVPASPTPAEPTTPAGSSAESSAPVSSSEGSSGGSSSSDQGQTAGPDLVTAPTPELASPAAPPDVVTAPPVESGDDGQSDAFEINADLRVELDPGASGTTVGGAVIGGQRDRYTLQALSGQTLSIDITSVEENAVFDLFTPSGSLIMGEKTSDSVTLSEDGTYEVFVGGTRGNATYEISFTIE